MNDVSKTLSDALGIDCMDVTTDEDLEVLRGVFALQVQELFDYRIIETLDERLLVVRLRGFLKPEELVNTLALVSGMVDATVVCHLKSVTPYVRKLLLEAREGFVTDDGQAYVPGLLRAFSVGRYNRTPSKKPWGPAERMAFIYVLQHVGEEVTALMLHETTGMALATASRSLLCLSDAVTLERSIGGRTKRVALWRADDPESFVHAGTVAFGKPVSRVFYAMDVDVAQLPLAGRSALAARTEMAAPDRPVRACSTKAANHIRAVSHPAARDSEVCEVHVLKYDPTPFVEDGLVDPYTMIRTIDDVDEEVVRYVGEATKQCPWLCGALPQ